MSSLYVYEYRGNYSGWLASIGYADVLITEIPPDIIVPAIRKIFSDKNHSVPSFAVINFLRGYTGIYIPEVLLNDLKINGREYEVVKLDPLLSS